MTRGKVDWRAKLTPEEAAEVAAIAQERAGIARRKAELRIAYNSILVKAYDRARRPTTTAEGD